MRLPKANLGEFRAGRAVHGRAMRRDAPPQAREPASSAAKRSSGRVDFGASEAAAAAAVSGASAGRPLARALALALALAAAMRARTGCRAEAEASRAGARSASSCTRVGWGGSMAPAARTACTCWNHSSVMRAS